MAATGAFINVRAEDLARALVREPGAFRDVLDILAAGSAADMARFAARVADAPSVAEVARDVPVLLRLIAERIEAGFSAGPARAVA